MTLAERLVRLCLPWLPPHLRDWGEAMAREAGAIPGGVQALMFAMGCVAFSARVSIGVRVRAALRFAHDTSGTPMQGLREPRGFALACAFMATPMGLVHLGATGATSGMLVMNTMAFVAGLVLILPLVRGETAGRPFFGVLSVGTGAVLLLTAIFGEQVSGAARWLSIGQVVLQPSLILLPLTVAGFARTRDALTACGIVMAAIALALQPDRGMAGALLAALAAVTIFARDPRTLFCLGVAGLAFAVTCFRPDIAPATPHVDRMFRTAVSNGLVSGLSVWAGAVVLMLPAAFGILRERHQRAVHSAFGATWLAVMVAAAWAGSPTPFIGYGGSAIVGYILATLALPRHLAASGIALKAATMESDRHERRLLRLVTGA